MKNKWWLSLFFVLLHAPGVWANGGPVAWTGTTPLGAIGLKDNPSVSLTSEHLKIDVLDLNTYGVKAVYRLKSSAAVKNLKFGVPINWTSSEFQEPDPATLAKGPGQPPPAAVAKGVPQGT